MYIPASYSQLSTSFSMNLKLTLSLFTMFMGYFYPQAKAEPK